MVCYIEVIFFHQDVSCLTCKLGQHDLLLKSSSQINMLGQMTQKENLIYVICTNFPWVGPMRFSRVYSLKLK